MEPRDTLLYRPVNKVNMYTPSSLLILSEYVYSLLSPHPLGVCILPPLSSSSRSVIRVEYYTVCAVCPKLEIFTSPSPIELCMKGLFCCNMSHSLPLLVSNSRAFFHLGVGGGWGGEGGWVVRSATECGTYNCCLFQVVLMKQIVFHRLQCY